MNDAASKIHYENTNEKVMNRVIAIAAVCMLSLVMTTKLPAQVVQLPSIQTFSYSGSVLVPDGGTTSLGSVNRASQFSRSSGFLGGRNSRGSSASHSGLSASVTIIDLDEMDRQLRGISETRRTPTIDRTSMRPAQLAGTRTTKPPLENDSKKTEAAKANMRLARRYFKIGEMGRAKIAYQDAIADLDGSLQEFAIREYREIFLPHLY